ncbi:three-Cys-motif partner protein TcmP [Jiella sp. M17.18]|uniref:three-Cys-motif partner protein TcmP n=1 Tax=Jiella sp. M17.18 TaxID=3234247 RepID=UPI0034DEB74C
MPSSQKFFEERTDQSEVKARIIQKYFFAWANIIKGTAKQLDNKIAYIDLYAGPGRYKDGAASTPLLVLEHAIADADLANMLVALLNDKDPANASTLEDEINKLVGIEKLRYRPQISNGEVDDDAAKYFSSTRLIPSFSFVDPFGYKGLSLEIIKGVIKDWGCDCVFFFNYGRINAGISNPMVRSHMNKLFGEERAEDLRLQVEGKDPALREAMILEALSGEIKSLGGKYVLPFTFKNSTGNRTSHKLIVVSKHFKGYDVMKDIMAKESSVHDQGVPSLTYSPADASTPLLFSLQRPIEELEQDLIETFAGRELNFDEIYEEHSIDTPYIRQNYREILKKMESDGSVTAASATKARRGMTYPPHVKIKFRVK